MTVIKLIEELQKVYDEGHGDIEVVCGYSYPHEIEKVEYMGDKLYISCNPIIATINLEPLIDKVKAIGGAEYEPEISPPVIELDSDAIKLCRRNLMKWLEEDDEPGLLPYEDIDD